MHTVKKEEKNSLQLRGENEGTEELSGHSAEPWAGLQAALFFLPRLRVFNCTKTSSSHQPSTASEECAELLVRRKDLCDPKASKQRNRGQNNQREERGFWPSLVHHLEGQSVSQQLGRGQGHSLFSFHTQVKREKCILEKTCNIFCTVLIICSILLCRNYCDMSSIK